MSSIYKRGNMYWCSVKVAPKRWVRKTTGFTLAQKREAQRFADSAQAELDRMHATGEIGPITVGRFAKGWLIEREKLGLDWKNDEARLRIHVLPAIGDLKLTEVRTRHLMELFTKLRTDEDAKRAPRTLRNVYSVICALFRDAKRADLMEHDPCDLDERDTGPLEDADPEWRAGALFTRGEVERLVADPAVPPDRRMVYALGSLAGLRHGEIAGLRWSRYEAEIEPLGCLVIATSYDKGRTKTGARRRVPVHPALAALLAEWKLSGWPAMMGRTPEADDLVVPLPPAAQARRWKRKASPMREKNYSWQRLVEDLAALELRHRSGHDMRATFITLLLDDGADPHVIETRVTHTRKSKNRSAFDGYNRGEQWAAVCREVGKLRISLKPRGEIRPFLTPVLTATGNSGEALGKSGDPTGNRKRVTGRDGGQEAATIQADRLSVASSGQLRTSIVKSDAQRAVELAHAVLDGDDDRARSIAMEIVGRVAATG